MHYIRQHIHNIINAYDGSLPLAHYLKQYLKQHPKLGSRDRKMLHEMAYCWYRCSKGLNSILFEDKLYACLTLCSTQQKVIDMLLPDTWRFDTNIGISERMDALQKKGITFNVDELFPYAFVLSDGITKSQWLRSMLVQPRLFIRIRKQKDKIVALLHEQHIPFSFITDTCIALPNGAAIDKLLPEDAYVVQDASSQETGSYFRPTKNEQWYDCCSGAGGKSLVLKDIEQNVQLTVSDKRESILHNLKNRFRQYHHALPAAYVLDVADKEQLDKQLGNKLFDSIICDVPCSGSGTWARTPEQLHFFKPEMVAALSQLQQRIAGNAATRLKPNGRLIYITCSVFRDENEAIVQSIIEHTGLFVENMQLINGTGREADSMFVSVLRRQP